MDDEKPGLASLVMTSYNHSKFLARRMESLINQTYRNIEILVIDDCSTENNREILSSYEAHPLVDLLFRQQNGGLVLTMNQGIELSSGEFILIAQCDDDCSPTLVERLIGALKAHPTAGIAYCRSLLIDENDQVLGDDFTVRERAFRARCATDTLLSGKEMSRFLLHSCVIPNMSALLIRRTCLAAVGNVSSVYTTCVDWELFFRIAARYDVAYVAEPLNMFRQHNGAIRNRTKDRVTSGEYLHLLSGQVRRQGLTVIERCRFRTRLMYMWSVHLIAPSFSGLRNFPYHSSIVVQRDPIALFFLLPGLLLRFLQVLGKFIYGRQLQMKSQRG